jgi:hypothetical protein
MPGTTRTTSFNIYKLYMVITFHLYVIRIKKTFALYNINNLVFITEVEDVYSAVRTESLYNTDTVS